MSSTITAGNATNGLAIASDNTGQLEIKTGTGAGTTALTLSSAQVATFAGAITSSGLVTGATGALYPVVQSTSVTLTTQTAVEFTNLPSWVKRITIMYSGLSTNSTGNILVQLGTGATPTYTTSGYLGGSLSGGGGGSNYTTAFLISQNVGATDIYHGSMVIYNVTGNTWGETHTSTLSDSVGIRQGSGSITLGAALTAVRLYINGTQQFDAGTVNILYE